MTKHIDMNNYMIIKIYILNLLFVSLISLKSQNGIYVEKGIGYPEYQIQGMNFDSLNSINNEIHSILDSFIVYHFRYYGTKLEFIKGREFNLDSCISGKVKEVSNINRSKNPIPKYEFTYSFKDTSIGIRSYGVTIGMDEYGQIMKCNFPEIFMSGNILSLEETKQYSDSLIKLSNPDIDVKKYKTEINFEKRLQRFVYWFCYYKEKGRYDCLIIDAHTKSLYEKGAMYTGNIDYCCCEQHIELIRDVEK